MKGICYTSTYFGLLSRLQTVNSSASDQNEGIRAASCARRERKISVAQDRLRTDHKQKYFAYRNTLLVVSNRLPLYNITVYT